jgi:hypothetical protein
MTEPGDRDADTGFRVTGLYGAVDRAGEFRTRDLNAGHWAASCRE